MNNYSKVLTKVLNGEPLNAKDEYSFQHPPVLSAEDWEKLLNETWLEAENFAALIETLPEEKLAEIFVHENMATTIGTSIALSSISIITPGRLSSLKKYCFILKRDEYHAVVSGAITGLIDRYLFLRLSFLGGNFSPTSICYLWTPLYIRDDDRKKHRFSY